jgi:hypothetical protein
VKLFFGNGRDGTVSGGAKLQNSLDAVVFEERGTKDLGELTGGMPSEEVHLEETVLSGNEALREDEVIKRGGADMRNAVDITLDGDGSRKALDDERAIRLRKRSDEHMANVAAGGEECGEADDKQDRDSDGEKSGKSTPLSAR